MYVCMYVCMYVIISCEKNNFCKIFNRKYSIFSMYVCMYVSVFRVMTLVLVAKILLSMYATYTASHYLLPLFA